MIPIQTEFTEKVGCELLKNKLNERNNMQKFLDGKRTWIGLFVTIAGVFGLGGVLADGKVEAILDMVFQIVGMVIAVYGNWKAQKKIVDLKEEVAV